MRKYATGIKFLMILLSVFLIILALPKQTKFRYEFEKGRIWNQSDLVAPYNFAILKTSTDLEKDRLAVLQNVAPIYRYNEDVQMQQVEGFVNDFNLKWPNAGIPEKLKDKYVETGKVLLAHVYVTGLLNPTAKREPVTQYFNITVVNKNNIAADKNTSVLYTKEKAINYFEEELTLRGLDRAFMLDLMQNRLQNNLIYDDKLTGKLKDDVLSGISATQGMVQKGELIVAKGTVINDDIYQKLLSYKKYFEDSARVNGNRKLVFLGQFFLVGLTVTLLIVFLHLFRKDIYQDNRMVGLILLVITAMLATLSAAIKFQVPNLYYIPYCIVPIIIRILFDTRLALNIHLLVIMIAGFYVPNSFEFAFYEITAGMVSIYSIKNLLRRGQFLTSALLITLTYLVAFLGISFIREGDIASIEWIEFFPFIVSVMLTLLAYPLIYAFEKVFRITSDLTLIELTNTNAHLLREMAFKAPGTFQHSLQVANLAENAIYSIGGNALLVRAGALYHDIGKMENPLYFIENQTAGFNPHDKLPYEESAQIIISHVRKGVDIATKADLPEAIINFIRTHHGNTRVDYFYQSFLKNFPEKFIDENIFRYPGPIPFSKETGVLMLADSIEAASRSIKEPDAKSISELVDRIVNYKLNQNQLKDSDITLKDLETIKTIFKRMLMSIYHVRIDY
ncbi:HDIG domain-containing metalloprotein [Mucilaginibacter sp. CSA2-8R]|uniref:HD family phosphohydrolase n=1 Tax=Mucilaginibacter sp. CSA2-8R TaxID=3141542 RepID=UPI00315D85DD